MRSRVGHEGSQGVSAIEGPARAAAEQLEACVAGWDRLPDDQAMSVDLTLTRHRQIKKLEVRETSRSDAVDRCVLELVQDLHVVRRVGLNTPLTLDVAFRQPVWEP